MGSVHSIEDSRLRPAEPPRPRDRLFSHEIEGRCSGCQARRSFVVAFHDTGTKQGTVIFSRTLPHYLCDGEAVIQQDDPTTPVP